MPFAAEDLLTEAVRLAGGEQSTAEDILAARRVLYLRLEEWAASFGNSFRVRRTLIPTLPATPGVQLDPATDDVISVLVGPQGIPVRERITPIVYSQIVNKTQGSQPSRFYVERGEPPTLFLHPTGAGMACTVWWFASAAGYGYDSNQLDAPARWYRPLVLSVAYDLACGRIMPDPRMSELHERRIIRLKTDLDEALAKAMPNDRQRAPFRLQLR
jgi:hypothetical protein